MRQAGPTKVSMGVQLKAKEKTDCPANVKFKWNNDRMTYFRSRTICMQHNHPLEVKDRHTIISSPEMLNDIDLFVRCQVSVSNIVKLLNKKYKGVAIARYQDVYNLVK